MNRQMQSMKKFLDQNKRNDEKPTRKKTKNEGEQKQRHAKTIHSDNRNNNNSDKQESNGKQQLA